ncbi:MAG: hypothetical protein Ct9H300mP28_26220 [Pseudomonadota bacterium]|nr:MAG: hypothetical protein Ct9H300mP28_26220 [Pseudomonadota bacterium]
MLNSRHLVVDLPLRVPALQQNGSKEKILIKAMSIKNTEIVEELSLPPVKIHCSVLAEDAIKAAISDYRKRSEG